MPELSESRKRSSGATVRFPLCRSGNPSEALFFAREQVDGFRKKSDFQAMTQVTFETARLKLNALNETDLDFFLEIQTDIRAREFLGGPVELAVAKDKFQAALQALAPVRHWAVRNSASEPLGLITLSGHHGDSSAEISYQFLPRFWGQGFASEALTIVLAYSLNELRLPAVLAETQSLNLRSRTLLEKVGLRPWKTLERFGEEQIIYSTEFSDGRPQAS